MKIINGAPFISLKRFIEKVNNTFSYYLVNVGADEAGVN